MAPNPIQEDSNEVPLEDLGDEVFAEPTMEDAFDAAEYVRQLIARMESDDAPQPVATSEPAKVPAAPQKPESKKAPKPASSTDPAESQTATEPMPQQRSKRFRDPRSADAVQPGELATADATSSETRESAFASRAEELGAETDSAIRSTTEINVDLEKLREAVQLTTNDALYTFDCTSLVRRSYTQLFNAIFAIIVSVILTSMSDANLSNAHLGALALLAYAGVMCWRFWCNTRVLWRKIRQIAAE